MHERTICFIEAADVVPSFRNTVCQHFIFVEGYNIVELRTVLIFIKSKC